MVLSESLKQHKGTFNIQACLKNTVGGGGGGWIKARNKNCVWIAWVLIQHFQIDPSIQKSVSTAKSEEKLSLIFIHKREDVMEGCYTIFYKQSKQLNNPLECAVVTVPAAW